LKDAFENAASVFKAAKKPISFIRGIEIEREVDTNTWILRVANESMYSWKLPREIMPQPESKFNHILTIPSIVPEVFLGREDDLLWIHDRLFSPSDNILLLNGEGGLGKTSLAARYFDRYKAEYAHVAWVTSNKNAANALLTLTIPLGLAENEMFLRHDIPQRIEVLLTEMSNLPKPCLLIIDNANELEDLETYYPLLQRCSNFHILFTTRINKYGMATFVCITPLPEEVALELFKIYYKDFQSADELHFRELYRAVDGNTLILEVFAKNLDEFNNRLKRRYPLEELVRDVEKGLLQLEKNKAVYVRYQYLQNATPEEIIRAMYNISDLKPEEIALLAVFAALPPERIAFKDLEVLLQQENLDEMLLSLSTRGWLDYAHEVGAFRCSPVVQAAVRREHNNWMADCGTLVKGLTLELDPEKIHKDNFLRSTLYARYAETTFALLDKPDYDLAVLHDYLGNFHTVTGDLDKALLTFVQMERLFVTLLGSDQENWYFKYGLAVSFSKLGQAHADLGNLDQALRYFEQSYQLDKELNNTYPNNVYHKNNLAISYEKLGQTHAALGNLDQALRCFKKYNQLEKELYTAYPNNLDYKNNLAVSFAKLGQTHTDLGNLDHALEFFGHYYHLEEELSEASPDNMEYRNNLAISYQFLGLTHTYLDNLDQALSFFEQYNQLEKELTEASPNNLSFKDGLAISCRFMGQTHAKLGNLDQALKLFEQYHQLKKELSETSTNNVSFKNGLATSFSELGRTYAELGNLEQALRFFEQYFQLEKELAEASPNNVYFKNGFAISHSKLAMVYLKLQRNGAAIENIENYWRISHEIYTSSSQNISFCANYADALAVKSASMILVGERTGVSGIQEAIVLFEDLLKKTGRNYFAQKIVLCRKMQETDIDLRELIVEMLSF
jgi:tetratricopeptide (TPR) repeat protein